ncbi:hypothetical protein EDD86DRAFT_249867 [Gorgonomyces haynaldii]|nr:hypothetical protein EDD86DRAFT_249867 [Gorgonomyces haynaldii]
MTPYEETVIMTVVKMTGAIGILGVFLTLVVFYWNPKEFKKPMGHLVLALAGADFIDSLSKLLSDWGSAGAIKYSSTVTRFNAPRNPPLCYAQFAGVLEGDVSTLIFVFAMELMVVYVTTSKKYYAITKTQEMMVIVFGYLFPVPFIGMSIFAQSLGWGEIVTGGKWCYIDKSLFWPYQVAFYYVWQWAVFLKGNSKVLFVVRRMIAFLIAFFVGHIFSNINRINSYITGQEYYAFNLLQAILSPSRGMLNFLAFAYAVYASPKRQMETNKSPDESLQWSENKSSSGGKSDLKLFAKDVEKQVIYFKTPQSPTHLSAAQSRITSTDNTAIFGTAPMSFQSDVSRKPSQQR